MSGENWTFLELNRRQFIATSALGGLIVASPNVHARKASRKTDISEPELTVGLDPIAIVHPGCRLPHLYSSCRHQIELAAAVESGRLKLRRSEDLLHLTIEVRDGRFIEHCQQLFVCAEKTNPAILIIHFPAQHVPETAFPKDELDCGEAAGQVALPLESCLSDSSRLVFEIPPGTGIKVSIEDLLNWNDLPSRLVPVAVPMLGLQYQTGTIVAAPAEKTPRPPGDLETQILLPSGLILSTHIGMGWEHNASRFSLYIPSANGVQSTRTELWETRAVPNASFAVANPGVPDPRLNAIRAVWHLPSCADETPSPPSPPLPPLSSLPNAVDREQIVDLTSGFDLTFGNPAQPYDPPPLMCSDLRLAPHGGSLTVIGSWDPLNVHGARVPLDVVQYQHQIKQGRDQFVQVERLFVACNTGTFVILVQERERRFVPVVKDGEEGIGAVVIERWYSKHLPQVPYSYPVDGEPRIGRRWPYKSVKYKWPDKVELRRPVDLMTRKHDPNNRPAACWMIPSCGTEPLPIEYEATDLQGNVETCINPLLLVRLDVATELANDALLREVLARYADDPDFDQSAGDWLPLKRRHYRRCSMSGQKVRAVPLPAGSGGEASDHGSFTVGALTFGVELADAGWNVTFPAEKDTTTALMPSEFLDDWKRTQVRFYPAVAEFEARLRDVEAFSIGTDAKIGNLSWHPLYRALGFSGEIASLPPEQRNKGEVFFELQNKLKMEFAGDRGGGLATPNVNVGQISRKTGVVGEPEGGRAVARVAGALSFVSGEFRPEDFFPLDAKLIGDITISDVLTLVPDLGEELGKIPKLLADEFADVKAALDQLGTVVAWIEKLRQASRVAEALFSGDIDRIRTLVLREVRELALNEIDDWLNHLGSAFTERIDTPDALSVYRTVAVILDSVRRNYPAVTSEQLLELKDRFSIDRLSRAVKSVVKTLADEIAQFNPVDLLAPVRRIVDVAGMLSDPRRILDGSFLTELDKAIDALGLGPAGLQGVLEQQAENFVSRLETAIFNSADHLENEINAIVDESVNNSAMKLLKGSFPNAIDPLISTDAATRVLAFKDYLQREVLGRWNAFTQAGVEAISRFLDEALDDPGLATLVATVDRELQGIATLIGEARQAVNEALASIPRSIVVEYDWSTDLQTGPAGFPIFVASSLSQGRKARLVLHTRIEKKLGLTASELRSPPSFEAYLSLTDFQIVLIPTLEFVIVGFKTLRIESRGLQAPKVTAELEGIEFGDSLEFVQKLASLFRSGSGFYLKTSFQGIVAGYRFGIPDFSLGAFNLADLSIGVDFTLPFDGSPLGLGLRLSERSRPCLLSVGVLGGTAYFGIVLSPRHAGVSVQGLEAQLEFGAVVNASLGPASGRLYVFGGFYYGRQCDSVTFTGFVRAGGSLDVLGLITVSAEFYVGLTYKKTGTSTQAYGEARITVRIKIIFVINVSVEVYFRKQFQGSESGSNRLAEASRGPGALRLVSVDQAETPGPRPRRGINDREWVDYCQQFA